jgi:hypothetical protein
MKRLLLCAAMWLVAAVAPLKAAEGDLKDVEALMRLAPSRHMGSGQREALDNFVAERFKATGFESGKITFPTAAFVPGTAEIALPDGSVIPLHPMYPNSAHPGNIPGGKWSGALVDLGKGTLADLQTASPMNAAALMDMDSHRAWVTALELGAQALIFVGKDVENARQAALKIYPAPLSVPRFYALPADGAKLRGWVKGGKPGAVHIRQATPNRWALVQAVNNWVVVPGDAAAEKVVHLQAYKDAASIVPSMSHGAESACNLALLLRLLDHYAKNKPQCTMVFSAVSDHCNYLRGEAFFLASVYPEKNPTNDEMEQRTKDLKEAEFYAKVYGDTSPEQIVRMRTDSSMETGRSLQLKKPLWDEFTYQRNKTHHRKAQIHYQLKMGKVTPEEKKRLEEERTALEARIDDYVAMMSILAKWSRSVKFEDLSSERKAEFVSMMKQQERRYLDRAEDARNQMAEIDTNGALAKLLAGKTPHLYLSLDLTFGGERMGFFYQGSDTRGDLGSATSMISPLARLSVNVAKNVKGGKEHFADTIQNSGGVVWQSHLGDKFPMAATMGAMLVVPSLTLTTTADTRDTVFTPSDTLGNLNRPRAAAMVGFAQRYLTTLLEHAEFPKSIRASRTRNYSVYTFRYNLRRMDPYSVEIPRQPLVNGVVVTRGFSFPLTMPPVCGQVLTNQVAVSDRQGTALFRATPRLSQIEAYGFTQDFSRIDAVIDAGAGARRVQPMILGQGARWIWDDHMALLFDCVQTDLVGLNDPSTRARTEMLIVLDGIRESSPLHYGIAGVLEERTKFVPIVGEEGVGCVFVEPGTPVKVVSKNFLLINVIDAPKNKPTGVGYLPGDPRLRTIMYTSAKDIQKLNGVRLKRIEEKGVSNAAAVILFKQGEELIKTAEAEREAGRQGSFFTKSVEALSSSLRSYVMVRDATMDLIKAVAVFLALVIPFCLFVTQLVTPWTDIRMQIASFVVIFVVMAVGLAMLHPAFSLSQTPMMVLLAFVMVGLAVFVMLILHARFDAGLQRLVEESQGAESSEGSRKMLAGVAFNVGVNNMRRRRIRTTLTAATIVLVTFTMLSVISVGQSLSPYRRKTDPNVPYNGVLFAKAGMGPIADSTAVNVTALFNPYGTVVKRTWTQRLDAYGGYLPQPVVDPASGKSVSMNAAVGVQLAEDGFIRKMPIVAGRWFSAEDAAEIILSADTASFLGIGKEDFQPRELSFRNRKVTLVGLLDDDKLAAMHDMARLRLLPLKSIPDPVTRTVSETGEMKVSQEDAMAGPAPSAQALRPQDVALLPVGMALQLPDTSCRSIALKTRDTETAWKAANHFVNATGTLTYTALGEKYTTPDGTVLQPSQYSLGAPVGAAIGGVGKVVIPICLAATIILNTMLGTVMERRKEIAVYNSIGLNPTHVFVFFVAEAVVFGIIGSVAGYLIGQGLGLAIVKFNLLPGVNLNYSSMAVMVVIFAAIVTVIVSTLYPAYIATRAAVPSGQRRWKLPPPVGDELRLDFPFSYSEHQLAGVLAYLNAFMDLNSEASSGQFLSQDARFGFVRDDEGRKVLAVTYNVTPVPFDLGVNQRMEVYGYYQTKVRAYVVAVVLTRQKGDKNSWLTVNQPYLESLRARLLSWRSQSKANQEQFRVQGEALFAQAKEFPVQESGSR